MSELYIPNLSTDEFGPFVQGLASNFGLLANLFPRVEGLENDPIVGSNENGIYMKWENGILVSFKAHHEQDVPITLEYGALYRTSENYNIPFPAEFIAPPVVIIAGNLYAPYSYINSVTTDRVQIRYARVSAATTSPTVYVLAIGLWKEVE